MQTTTITSDPFKTERMLQRMDALAERPGIKIALLAMRLTDARQQGDNRPSAEILKSFIACGDDAAELTANAERLYFRTNRAKGRA